MRGLMLLPRLLQRRRAARPQRSISLRRLRDRRELLFQLRKLRRGFGDQDLAAEERLGLSVGRCRQKSRLRWR